MAERLFRAPALAARRAGRVKTAPFRIVWHDTADGALAKRGLALAESRDLWRLEKLVPDNALWPPASPAPVLGCGNAPNAAFAAAGLEAPAEPLVAVAAFAGRQRQAGLMLAGGPALPAGEALLLDGALRGVLQDRAACRLVLSGERRAVAALAEELGTAFGLRVPPASLAAEALALARGTPASPRRLGAPVVASGATTGQALTAITAHLADVLLYWSGEIGAGAGMEPVHQMRVAARRLRSALAVFRRAAGEDDAWLASCSAALRQLGQLLGAARDWDVFLAETGAALRDAVPGDKRIGAMLAASERKRSVAYAALAAYLAEETGWRRLALHLALLPTAKPWAAAEEMDRPARDYAARALSRRLKHVLAPGDTLAGLSHDELHAVRKQAKQLRYATEFFTPLFPEKAVRRYLRRLESVQEAFGALNDGAVATTLAQSLNSSYAEGIVQGFTAARGLDAARQVRKSWARFYREEPFWL